MLEACSNEIIKEDSGWSPRHCPGKPTSVTSDKLNMPQALRIQSIFMGPHKLPLPETPDIWSTQERQDW